MGEPKKAGNKDFLGFLFGKLFEPLERVAEDAANASASKQEDKDTIDTTAEIVEETNGS